MPAFNSTSNYLQKYRSIEVFCWTCQRPMLRLPRNMKGARGHGSFHYCSLPCMNAAGDWRRNSQLWAKVRLEGECWIWQGYRDKHGYGRFHVRRRRYLVHRYVYEMARGPIPSSLVLDHLCRRPPCLNPAHLEAVTHDVNMARGIYATRTHCEHGHLYTPENTMLIKGRWRKCRTCDRLRKQSRMIRSHFL